MISIIAAVGKNGEIGKNNDLIWHLKSDLKYFKEKTLNHKVIMGYKTYLSIGKPLPNRVNIVISKDKNVIKDSSVRVYDNIEEMIEKEINNNEECFIIGGSSMYNYFYPLADRMYLTLIQEEDKDADVYFPKINKNEWNQEIIQNNEENGIKFDFVIFERKKNE